jgi:hypothetical protein
VSETSVQEMTIPPPQRWDSGRIVAQCHLLGASLNLTRERDDRHRYPAGPGGAPGPYFEVGYGPILTVTVRFSWDLRNPWIVTRENYRPDKFGALLDRLRAPLSWGAFGQPIEIPARMVGGKA